MNYFKKPGQSSTVLSCYENDGNRSGDMVLEYERLQSAGLFWKYIFEMGDMFEAICRDLATGSKTFNAGWFISELAKLGFSETDGKKSHASEVVWIVKNWTGDIVEKLSGPDGIKRNKPKKGESVGEENATHKKGGNFLARECMENPGRVPVTQSDYKGLLELAKRTLDMPLPEWWWGMKGWTIGDFIGNDLCQWQKEIYWTDRHGILKKAMTDCLLVYKGTAGIIDLKWTAALSNFEKRLRGGKWIQAPHYEQSVQTKYDVEVLPMLYVIGIAGGKSEPPLATARAIEDGPHIRSGRCFCGDCRRAKYEEISLAYHQWEIEGRKPSGFLEGKTVRIWV